MRKMFKPCGVLFFFLLSLFVYGKASDVRNSAMSNAPIVIYVPGWLSKERSQIKPVERLQKIYPGCKIIIKRWESAGTFYESKDRADKYVEILVKEILSMPPEEQADIILIGHSLGGRIVVKTIAKLGENNVHIRKGIFLGSAIPDNAPEIDKAIKSTREPCINIYNRKDYTLSELYGIFGEKGFVESLGTYGYAKAFFGVHMLQYEIRVSASESYLENHGVLLYLSKLAEIDRLNQRQKILNSDTSWTPASQCCNWKMEKQKSTLSFRIVNPYGEIIYQGDKQNTEIHWKRLSGYYQQTSQAMIDLVKIPDSRKSKIDPKHYKSNWDNIAEINGWRLLKGKHFLNKKRFCIIDPRDYLRVSGQENEMRNIFDDIKKQIKRFQSSVVQ